MTNGSRNGSLHEPFDESLLWDKLDESKKSREVHEGGANEGAWLSYVDLDSFYLKLIALTNHLAGNNNTLKTNFSM